MGKTGYSRRDAAQPAAHGSTRRPRGDGRLDPVRWRRPGRGLLLRLVAVAALLATAAAVLWSSPSTPSSSSSAQQQSCVQPPAASAATPKASGAAKGAVPGVPEGSVGVPIRLADPTALGLVRPGNRVDLLRIDGADRPATTISRAALVLRVTGADDPATGGLLLALSPEEASQAVATSRQGFAIVIRPG